MLFALAALLLLSPPCPASSRWTTAFADAQDAALVLGGAAFGQGSDPAQWSGMEASRLQLSQLVGPGESLGNALSLCGPLATGLSYGLQASQLRGNDDRVDGKARQTYRDARLRFGLAMAEPLRDKRLGLAYGLALNYYDHTVGTVRRFGCGVDLNARGPLPGGFSLALALRDLKIPNSFADELPSEGALGLGLELGRAELGADVAVPLPSASRGPVMARLAATYALTPWARLMAGVSSSEVAGQGGHFGFGGSLRQDGLELSLSAVQRPQPEQTSVHASLAWHFQAPAAQPKPAYRAPRPVEPLPEPTPEPETGSFDLQAAYRDGQIHVAWPALPPAPGGYDLLMGLVPGASMKKVNEEPLKKAQWSGSPGMLGLTYYFRVRALDLSGAETAKSRLCSLLVPAKETP